MFLVWNIVNCSTFLGVSSFDSRIKIVLISGFVRSSGRYHVTHNTRRRILPVNRGQEVDQMIHLHKDIIISFENKGWLLLALLCHPLVTHHVFVGEVGGVINKASLQNILVDNVLPRQQLIHRISFVSTSFKWRCFGETILIERSGSDRVGWLCFDVDWRGSLVLTHDKQYSHLSTLAPGHRSPVLSDQLSLFEVLWSGVDQDQQIEILSADMVRVWLDAVEEVSQIQESVARCLPTRILSYNVVTGGVELVSCVGEWYEWHQAGDHEYHGGDGWLDDGCWQDHCWLVPCQISTVVSCSPIWPTQCHWSLLHTRSAESVSPGHCATLSLINSMGASVTGPVIPTLTTRTSRHHHNILHGTSARNDDRFICVNIRKFRNTFVLSIHRCPN